jgi:hypothetical protein
MVVDITPEGSNEVMYVASHREAANAGTRFIGVNLKHMIYARERDTHFEPPADYTLVAEALHPNAFTATVYEAHKPWQRRRFLERGYTMRIYRRVRDAGSLALGRRD